MGHTNSTANLALPQFIGTDKPTWLSDVNGAFAAIDTYAGTNDAALAITDAKADSAVNDAASAVTTATNAANTAGTASTQATNAVTVAGNALTVANGINSKVGVLTDLHTTDKSTVVNAINEVKDAEGDLTSLTTSDKSSLVAAINEVAGGGGAGYVTHTVNDLLSNSYSTIAGIITGCTDAVMILEDGSGRESAFHLSYLLYNSDSTFSKACFTNISVAAGPNIFFNAITFDSSSLIAATVASITNPSTCATTDAASTFGGQTVKRILTI